MLYLNVAIRRFCDVTKWNEAFYDSVSKNKPIFTKFEPQVTSLQKCCQFSKIWLWNHNNNLINLKPIFLKKLVKHHLVCKICCFHDFGLEGK